MLLIKKRFRQVLRYSRYFMIELVFPEYLPLLLVLIVGIFNETLVAEDVS